MVEILLIAWLIVGALAIVGNLALISVSPRTSKITPGSQIPALLINSAMFVWTLITVLNS